MERTAYHRPLDHPLPTLAPLTPLAIDRVVETLALNLQQGDRIVQDGFVPLTVTDTDDRIVVAGMVSVAYTCTAGSGWRVYPAEQVLQVRRLETVAH